MAEMALGRTAAKPCKGSTQASITSLPFEILTHILWNERLKRSDVAAVRLSCRELGPASAARLFYRISISKLRADRDAFLSICHRPYLAQNVREVEWLEISWDAGLMNRVTSRPNVKLEDDEVIADLCHHLDTAVEAECWLPNTPADADDVQREAVESAREKAVAGFRGTFQAAIDNLPNLHTFVSRPMSSTRIIIHGSYPITASLLQGHQDQVVSPAIPEINDGLFFFLLPVMDRPTSPIRRLRWADEFPGLSYLRPLSPSSLERLESLDLCFTPTSSYEEESLTALRAAYARAAPSIRHLKLCIDHGAPCRSHVAQMILGPALATGKECALQSLNLGSVRVHEDSLMSIIKAHASSMRHLYLQGYPVSQRLIHNLRELPDLKLETFQIMGDDVAEIINGRGLSWSHLTFATAYPWLLSAADESDSDTSSEDSRAIRRRTGPRWVFGRYFHRGSGDIFCIRVPDGSNGGSTTEIWKFTHRNGTVGYGDEPLDWFEEWDVDAGDREEPTPFGSALDGFRRLGDHMMKDVASYLGETLNLLKQVELPEGAILYNEAEDPTYSEPW